MHPPITWPDGKKFAFTVFDDTDYQTMVNAPPIYQFLADQGFRTTKSMWPIKGGGVPHCGGETGEDPEYAEWVRSLQRLGFEIGLHNATYHTSTREETQRGFALFQEMFGHPPRSLANHTGCDESIYWGVHRLTGINALLYKVLNRFKPSPFAGHIEGSPLFWGDLCKQHVQYVRNFVFGEINTLKVCPLMPYYDPARPYVNGWFASSEGPVASTFVEMISEANQDRLEAEGGACIMYTHFGSGFYENGRLEPRFELLMKRLSQKNGWFVPVSTLLDFLRERNKGHVITPSERSALERKWLAHKIRVGGRS
jgi:hypothetical protein